MRNLTLTLGASGVVCAHGSHRREVPDGHFLERVEFFDSASNELELALLSVDGADLVVTLGALRAWARALQSQAEPPQAVHS